MLVNGRRSRWSSYQSKDVGENRHQTNAVLSIYSDIMGCTFTRSEDRYAAIDATLYRNNTIHSHVEIKTRPDITFEQAISKGWAREMFINFSKISAGLSQCLSNGAPLVIIFAFPLSNIAVSKRVLWKTDSGCVMVAGMKTKLGDAEYGNAASETRRKRSETLALIDITTPDIMQFSIPNHSS